jgi:hypothetical protein
MTHFPEYFPTLDAGSAKDDTPVLQAAEVT